MTRKDYVMLAAAVASERAKVAASGWTGDQAKAWRVACESIALNLADALAAENPRFDRARFLKGCGVAA